jgi:AsmA protein
MPQMPTSSPINLAKRVGSLKKNYLLIGTILSVLFFALAIWAFMHPGFAAAQLQDYVMRKTGRSVTVNGGVSLRYFPQLSVRLDNVVISNPDGMEGSFAQADIVELPMQLGDLLRRRLRIREVRLTNPQFNLLVDGMNRNNWSADKSPGAGKAGNAILTPSLNEALNLHVEGGTFSFTDERHAVAFAIGNATADVVVTEEAELSISGTASVNSEASRIDAHIKSLQRVAADGSPADISVKSAAMSLDFSGRLGTRVGPNLAGSLVVGAPDLRSLAKWLGTEIGGHAGLKDFMLSGALDSSGEALKLAKASVTLDGMTAKGDLFLDYSHETPRLSASLATDLLTLDPYFSASRDSAGAAPVDPTWKIDALNFSSLKGVNGAVALSAKAVKWGNFEIGAVDISSDLRDGVLETRFQNASLYGGTGSLKLVLDGSREESAMRLAVDGRGLKGEAFFNDFAGLDWLGGATGLQATLSASGKNQRDMMSTLKGNFTLEVSDGQIRGLNILDTVSKVSSAVVDGWGDAPGRLTAINRATATFAIEDGVAKTSDIRLQSPVFEITGGGELDMLRRALYFKFKPLLTIGDGAAAQLPVDIVVEGPWNKPRIYPDVDGVLQNPKAAYDVLRDLGVTEKTIKKIEKKGDKLLNKLMGN